VSRLYHIVCGHNASDFFFDIAHLFGNAELLYDVEKKSKTVGFTGISGSPTVTNTVGNFCGIKNVFTHERSPINILSWSCLQDHNPDIRKRSCEKTDTFALIFPSGKSMTFVRRGGLYVHDCAAEEAH
jgi:hypothetical protein